MDQSDKIGTLYLVATPIGNLDDMTFRAIKVLKEADALYCEDTRRTLILLNHFKIERASGIDSFHDHSPQSMIQKIKKQLEAGKSVAYATDGGMPVVSDPGFVLVRAANECGAAVTVVPGPSAANMVFAASGLPSPKYFFHGFFPRTRGEVERTLEVVRQNPVVHVFYEAPGRIIASLDVLARNLPKAPVVVGRELTKLHEEIARGTAEKVHAAFAAREKVRGECVIALMGGEPDSHTKKKWKATPNQDVPANEYYDGDKTSEPGEDAEAAVELSPEQQAEIASLIKSGVSSKDAARELSKKFRVPRRVIYEFIIRRLT